MSELKAGGGLMTKPDQIKWIVDWYWDNWKKNSNHSISLDASDFEFECKFIDATGKELNYTVWRSRIRDAATKIGLTGYRHYNSFSNPSAGIPRYSFIYS